MKQQIYIISLLAIFLGLCSTIKSQVTIGSGKRPSMGSLLDVKEFDTDDSRSVNGTTAARGIAMPRVKLTDKSNLFPMFAQTDGTANSEYDDASKKTAQDALHTGLLVYAVEKFGISPVYCPGMYVWSGEAWQPVSKSTIGRTHSPLSVSDVDGNVYSATFYGSDECSDEGTYWLDSNLLTTQKSTGGSFSVGNPRLNPALNNTLTGAISISSKTDLTSAANVAYGESAASISATNKNVSATDFAKRFGLLYTYAQAQEACPTGWHLATQSEWSALIGYMGGASVAGAKMRESNNYFASNDNADHAYKWGESETTSTFSGFKALPSGRADNDEFAGYFSNYAYWWTSDKSGAYAVYKRLDHNSSTILTGTGPTGVESTYLSVRCVKD